MECGFTWGHLTGCDLKSHRKILETFLMDVGFSNSLSPWRQPCRALLRGQHFLRTESFVLYTSLCPSRTSPAQAPAGSLLTGGAVRAPRCRYPWVLRAGQDADGGRRWCNSLGLLIHSEEAPLCLFAYSLVHPYWPSQVQIKGSRILFNRGQCL